MDKLTEVTTQKVNGKMAPDFDTFIWGWGGDPYDPGLLLSLLTTKAIGGSSDSFYSNPEYDRLYDQQTGEFDTAERKAIVQQMIALTQRDLPYLVLTVDPTCRPTGPTGSAASRRSARRRDRRRHLRPGRRTRRSPTLDAGDGRRRRRRRQRLRAASSCWSRWSIVIGAVSDHRRGARARPGAGRARAMRRT